MPPLKLIKSRIQRLTTSSLKKTRAKLDLTRDKNTGRIVDPKKSSNLIIREKALQIEQARIARRRRLQLSNWIKEINSELSSIRRGETVNSIKEKMFHELFDSEIRYQKKFANPTHKMFEIKLKDKFNSAFFTELYSLKSTLYNGKLDYAKIQNLVDHLSVSIHSNRKEILKNVRLDLNNRR
jgi:hypothetical protein